VSSLHNRILVAGIYLSYQKNNIEHIVDEFNSTLKWDVVQKWASIGKNHPSRQVKDVTFLPLENGLPKFILLNVLLAKENLDYYDFIIISDDDIVLPKSFVDTYLSFVQQYDFALAQPARTPNSFIDHPFVRQFEGIKARRTRFVEIGPLLSIRRDIFSAILPFDETSFMGWGYDYIWPCVVEGMKLRMGIIDAVPVDHSLRKPVKNYNYDEANNSMMVYLSRHPHLSKDEAFRILESYS
jgi:hypothetical protein